MWVCNIFVGQGPCALPRVREKSGSGRCGHRSLRKRILWCVGEGLSCPPLCRPTDGHCRARQSGHFLETGLLHPPLAALRRFPLPRATARVAPTEGYKECGKRIPQSRLRRARPALGKGAEGTGVRIATGAVRPRNDIAFARGTVWNRRADRGVRSYGSVSCSAQGSLFCIEKTTVRRRSFFIEDFTQPWEPRARQPERPQRQPWQQRPSSRRQPSAQP